MRVSQWLGLWELWDIRSLSDDWGPPLNLPVGHFMYYAVFTRWKTGKNLQDQNGNNFFSFISLVRSPSD